MWDLALIKVPARWDRPFDNGMTDEIVADMLAHAPFADIDPAGFHAPLTLKQILLHDARIIEVKEGGIVVRQQDFGTSVFFVLSGSLRVIQEEGQGSDGVDVPSLPRLGWWGALAQLWRNSPVREARDLGLRKGDTSLGEDVDGGPANRLYFTDVDDINGRYQDVARIGSGEIFGEISALDRSPRTATVYAETHTRLVEMRWQGFRDILKRNAMLRERVDRIYRERSIAVHLRTSPLFRHLDEKTLLEVATHTLFESYGDYDWHVDFNRKKKAAAPLSEHPENLTIAHEGHHVDGLIMLVAGFACTSVRYDHGEHTLAWLSRGDSFALDDIAGNVGRADDALHSLRRSLFAVGYAHVLRVPTSMVERYVIGQVDEASVPQGESTAAVDFEQLIGKPGRGIDQGMLEFLVEHRFINGTATMLIDLDRCTRCDDCVRACAAGHDGNPRFVRHGPVLDHFMVANACMQCNDPVCMIGCPTGAIHRRIGEGQVIIDDSICIGCATCANSCPYDNIRMVHIRDHANTQVISQANHQPVLKATKCDLCAQQMRSVAPACQNACPHDALIRVDMRDQDTLIAWLNR